MLHGRKKQEKQELTEQQKKEIEDKLQKITTINKTLLKKRANKEYDLASLEQTEKFSFLSPDFSTLWNYRREIISHLFETEWKDNMDKQYETVMKELEFLVKGITRSPKSYTLWFQRQWIIEKGLLVERKKLDSAEASAEGDQSKEWKSRILETELKLCDKMLSMDERNFHCWNYRLLIALQYLKEIELRVKEEFKSIQKSFLEKECLMAENLIKKNFSNFSAWHYRSKLMPILYEDQEGRTYLIPFTKIQEDLALLKHAFFTDPKDQSPWNYHEWLISLISPIQVVSLSIEEVNQELSIVVGLSHKVRNFSCLDIAFLNDQGEKISAEEIRVKPNRSNKNIASAWSVKIPGEIKPDSRFSFRICMNTEPNDFKSIDDLRIFREIFVHIDLEKKTFELPSGDIWVRDNTMIDNLMKVLDQDIENIKELIEFEKGLRFAVHRLKDLLLLKFEYLANPYYLNAGGIVTNDVSTELDNLTKTLREIDGKSHSLMHEKILKSFENVKFKWEKIYESGTLGFVSQNADQNEIADRHFGFFGC